MHARARTQYSDYPCASFVLIKFLEISFFYIRNKGEHHKKIKNLTDKLSHSDSMVRGTITIEGIYIGFRVRQTKFKIDLCQSQRTTYYMIPFYIKYPKQANPLRQKADW